MVRDFVPTEPNAATLVAQNPFLPEAPTSAILDYNAIHMWNLRMNGRPETPMPPYLIPRTARRLTG